MRYEPADQAGGLVLVPEIHFVRLPDVVLGAVVYLGHRMLPGIKDSPLDYVGSGFVVSVDRLGIRFYYLATAEHVKIKLMRKPDPVAR